MGTRRGAVSLLVSELIGEGAVFEGATGEAKRGRKPTFLYIDSRKRCVVAVDIRPTRTYIMVTDLVGRQLASVTTLSDRARSETVRGRPGETRQGDPRRTQGPGTLPGRRRRGARHGRFLHRHASCERRTSAGATSACAIRLRPDWACRCRSRIQARPARWRNSGRHAAPQAPSNFVYLTVSDGLGVGIVIGGELVRGQHNIAGEFGHVPLNVDGPRCGCGATGCWEAYVSNLATLSRYFGRDLRDRNAPDVAAMTIDDLIARARGGDAKALAALLSTARYLGLGLGSVVNAIDPAHVYIGGEITAAWDLIEATVRSASCRARADAACRRDADHDRAARAVSAPARRSGAGGRAGVREWGRRMRGRERAHSPLPSAVVVRPRAQRARRS